MKKSILIIFFVAVLAHIGLLVWDSGVFLSLENKNDFSCKPVIGIQGAEDLALAGDEVIAVSGYFPPRFPLNQIHPGTFFVLNPKDETILPKMAELGLSFPFNPHGFDVLAKSDSEYFILAINHRPTGDSLELFNYDSKTKAFTHIESHEDSGFITLNDVLYISPDEVLLSFNNGSADHSTQMLENFSRIGRGKVVHYNLKTREITELVTGMSFANGLAWVERGKKFIVAEMLSKKVHIYSLSDGKTTLDKSYSMPWFPDNITVSDGKALIGAHPKIFDLKDYSERKAESAPSGVLEVDLGSGEIKELFVDDGSLISSVSVALPFEDQLFLGTIYENKILRCRP